MHSTSVWLSINDYTDTEEAGTNNKSQTNILVSITQLLYTTNIYVKNITNIYVKNNML